MTGKPLIAVRGRGGWTSSEERGVDVGGGGHILVTTSEAVNAAVESTVR